MRGKIIAVFAVVVLVVGGLSYALVRAAVGDLSTPSDAPRALAAAAAQLQVDGLVLERWLANGVASSAVRDGFHAGTEPARLEAARTTADGLREAALSTPELSPLSIQLVAVVDPSGRVLARNGSALMRGDDLGAAYPGLRDALKKGATSSDVWVNRTRNEQMLVAYAAVRDSDGTVLGGVVVGTAFNDERLTNASTRTSGRMLAAVVREADHLDLVAKSAGVTPELASSIVSPRAAESILHSLATNQGVDVAGLPKEFPASAKALSGYGDGHRLALVSIATVAAPPLGGVLFWPILGAVAVGLILVIVGAYFLDEYISRPISEIEDGLLAIMNGRTERRFELEHAELGGVVFRLNSLLNQLFGVQEDETDAQGRPSREPAASSFQDALEVDERMASMSGEEVEDAKALRDEPADVYYRRLCEEYVGAKRSLGDPVDHITVEAFVARIRASEGELAERHGKPVRYKVDVRGREVVLLAVPLS